MALQLNIGQPEPGMLQRKSLEHSIEDLPRKIAPPAPAQAVERLVPVTDGPAVQLPERPEVSYETVIRKQPDGRRTTLHVGAHESPRQDSYGPRDRLPGLRDVMVTRIHPIHFADQEPVNTPGRIESERSAREGLERHERKTAGTDRA